jgi:tripartite motif-containing protein 71
MAPKADTPLFVVRMEPLMRRPFAQSFTAVSVIAGAAALALAGQSTAQANVTPSYLMTIGGPAVAAMYSSGLDYDVSNNRVVLADTGLDRVDFYAVTAGNGHLTGPGHIGSLGAGTPTVGSTAVQFDTPRDLTIDPANGDIYVADTQNNRVQKIDKDGRFVWQTKNMAHPMGISFDSLNGQVDVAMTGASTIAALSPSNGTVLWKSPTASSTGLSSPRDVIRAQNGLFWVDDYAHHEIKAYSVDAGGGGSWTPIGYLGTGSPGSANNQLSFPYNVVFSPDGNTAYVSDTGGHRIARWDISGAPSTWAALSPFGSACQTFPKICPDPPTDRGQWDDLRRVAVIPSTGQIIGDDFWGNGLQIWPADGTVSNIVEIEGNSLAATAADAGFAQAYGVAVSADGTVYAVDRLNQRIERFNSSGSWMNSAGNRGIDNATFSWPEGAAAAPDATIWVADSQHDTLKQWSTDLTTVKAPLGKKDTGKGLGQFSLPEGIAIDNFGGPTGYHVWVADTLNNRVQVGDHNGANWQAFTTANGQAFKHPRGLTSANGKVYVADSDNNRVVELTTSGGYVAQYSSGLKDPEGVAIAGDGSLWVANTQGSGTQTAMVHLASDLSMTLPDSFGGFCAPCTANDNSDFYRPHEVVIVGGILYVADTFNNRVQEYSLP